MAALARTKVNDNWRTPEWLYRALDLEFRFDLDPCPLDPAPKIDGLLLDWTGKRVFCNPPYSNIVPWVEKGLRSAALTVFLLPGRTDAKWFRELRDSGAEIRFLGGRIYFWDASGKEKTKPLCGSMIAVVRRLDRRK